MTIDLNCNFLLFLLKGPALPAGCVFGMWLDNYDNEVFHQTNSLEKCLEKCNETAEWICRSIEYNYDEKSCTLSSESRKTKPTAFQDKPNFVYCDKG